ncbi:TPA: hypothetical protein JG872_000360 [Enterobacter hormaechei subsp. xiangfangensis]|nr:hypothetical protein [Enterobacter hormaechei subsp. xiangfangensis]HAV1860666.1 hypothetical protein [Enterobacter hormaechei subsp. xiangfangensis]
MKVIAKAVIAAAVLTALTGCAPRYVSPEEQAMTNAAYKGAAMNQALQNAHDAAFDGKSISLGDKHHKHHNHKATGWTDESNTEDATDYDDQDVDGGVVYRHGKKGYLNSDGDFIQYGQSAHRHHNNKFETSCSDLKNFVKQGLELTPAQENQLGDCHINQRTTKGSKAGSKHWSGYGVNVRQDADGLVYIDDHAAAPDEQTEEASVFSQGFYQVIIRSNGKADLLKNGQFVGHLK